MAAPRRSNARSNSPGTSPAGNILAAQIDELGAIETRLLPYRSDIAREELLRKAIRNSFDNADPTKPFEQAATKYTAFVGARGLQTTIDFAKLIKAIGLKAFASIATVTLAALDAYAKTANAPGLAADCTRQANTGPRSLKIFARAGK